MGNRQNRRWRISFRLITNNDLAAKRKEYAKVHLLRAAISGRQIGADCNIVRGGKTRKLVPVAITFR